MLDRTRKLWERQDQHAGDRQRLFTAVAASVEATTVLYPGSFVDLAPSFVWPAVTYVDVDQRAEKFFADHDGIDELLTQHGADPATHTAQFFGADYQHHIELEEGSFDLLISLYAGFVSEHCTPYLRVGGHLLVNASHGDAAMASIDPRYELSAVITSRSGRYSLSSRNLGAYFVPKQEVDVTADHLHDTGRGVPYTKSPFAYIFERIR